MGAPKVSFLKPVRSTGTHSLVFLRLPTLRSEWDQLEHPGTNTTPEQDPVVVHTPFGMGQAREDKDPEYPATQDTPPVQVPATEEVAVPEVQARRGGRVQAAGTNNGVYIWMKQDDIKIITRARSFALNN